MKQLFALIFIAPLAGCLSSGMDFNLLGDSKRMTPEHAQTIKTAGVVSFLEPQPRIHFVSSSLKESNIRGANLSDWDANDTITTLLEKRLRQKGFSVVGIDADMSVKEAYSSSASFAEPERIRNRIVAIGRAHNVDMLVVVYRQQVRDFVGDSSQKIASYGLYKRHSESEVSAFSAVLVEAVNIKKGYVLGSSNGKVELTLDSSVWMDNFETQEGPFRIQAGREEITQTVINSVLIAAQEAGLSN